jgi:DNA polymerase III epsilon subunit-like protein
MASRQLVFVDLETAESSGVWSVIQVAAVAVSGDMRELGSFEAKLRVNGPVSHRRYDPAIWNERALQASVVAARFGEFLREHVSVDMTAVGGRPYRVAQIVAHNAEFDGAMLRSWFDRMNLFFPGHYRMLCTVQRAIWLFREKYELNPPPDYKLGTLCRYFGVPYRSEDAHDALYDVRATVELYREMTRVNRTGAFGRSGRATRSGGTARTPARRATVAGGSRRVWWPTSSRGRSARRRASPVRGVAPKRP